VGHLSAKELMLCGEPYDANDPALLDERRDCRLRCERFNALSFAQDSERRAALERLLGSFGEGAVVMAPFQCDYGTMIEIGPRTFVNYGAVVLDAAPVTIGADVQIGPRVQLLTALHPLDPVERARGTETVGAGAVVGAGSVVTRSMPAGHLCLGNPCRPVRELPGG
jgi:maltose O-acetyltransferase